MNKLFLYLFIFPAVGMAQTINGPIGDTWDNRHEMIIMRKDAPLYLTAETYIKAEKVIINRSIVTNGFGLTIEARELVLSPDVEIKSFDKPNLQQSFVDTTLTNTRPSGLSCSVSGTAAKEIGIAGTTGLNGFDVKEIPHQITIYATLINGQLTINGNGQQGGKGGKGGKGGRGLDGCDGENGEASCSGLLGTGDGRVRHGGAGKNGAHGGLGGSGGRGGQGGQNTLINISYLTNVNTAELKLSSHPGVGGDGGEPGDNGLSGAPGAGGNGDKEECGTFWDEETVKAHAGPAGGVATLKESSQSFEGRRGEKGAMGQEIPNAIKLSSFDEIKTEREKVISNIMNFHFHRTFYQLVQQSILIAINQKENPDIGMSVLTINEMAKRKLISEWRNGFIRSIQKDESADKELKEMELVALDLVNLLEGLNLNNRKESQDQLNLIIKKQRVTLKDKVRRIASACHSFMSIDAGNIEKNSELFVVPLCQNLQNLTSKPMSKLVVSKAIEIQIAGLSPDDYQHKNFSEDKDRVPSSDFEVIVVQNKKFGQQHFTDLRNWDQKESIALGTLRSLDSLNPEHLGLNVIGAYARLLKMGMQK